MGDRGEPLEWFAGPSELGRSEALEARAVPLREHDAALAVTLHARLVQVLRTELLLPLDQAQALAASVHWGVTNDRGSLWLWMDGIGCSRARPGDGLPDEEGADLYVRQLAYDLAGRSAEFEP